MNSPILPYLWFGKWKSIFDLFFHAFFQQGSALSQVGVMWTLGNKNIVRAVYFPIMVTDSVRVLSARELINLTDYTDTWCLMEAQTLTVFSSKLSSGFTGDRYNQS